MARFRVRVRQVMLFSVEVEAISKADARDKARQFAVPMPDPPTVTDPIWRDVELLSCAPVDEVTAPTPTRGPDE